MGNLFLNWSWFNEDGTPGAYLWAVCVLAAVVVFATIIFLIYRLYGRNKKKANQQVETTNLNVAQVQPVEFEKREDSQQLDFYDPTKAQQEAEEIERKRQEEERLQNMMQEEERKRKELEDRERAFEEKLQRDEEIRLEREREAEARIAEKERQAEARIAEKERMSAEKNNKNSNNFFMDNDDSVSAFSFGDDNQSDDAEDFWSQAKNFNESKPVDNAPTAQAVAVSDPRLDKLMEELENQKQAEQERFANLMAELEQQKQETARLQGELEGKNKSENLISQAKKEMEQMIKDSQEKINTLENAEKKNKDDKELLQEIRNVLAVEREAQEQRLREQENSLAAVLNAIENERRVKEENALYAEQEARKEDEFVKMQNQYQDAIAQMQAKFQQMLDEANAQKQVAPASVVDRESQNIYQIQLERERAETAALIEQMQQEVDRMNAEREAERRQYEEKQRSLDVTLAEALQTQRNEFEQAQQRVAETNMANVERILQDIERQRAQEQEMFNNILNEMAAEREDNVQTKAALEQMVRESEARIQKLENQSLPRGLDEESIASLKEVLAAEREEQFKRMEEYKAEIANLRDTIETDRQQRKNEEDDANQVTYVARDTEADEEMKARMEAMQSEIQYLNELRENERAESEKRHAELLETLNRSIVANENAKVAEVQQVERETIDRSEDDARIEMLMNELAESREDTRKAQEAMQQLIQESSDLINQLNNQKEVRGVNEATMSALKELLAQERDMQEKRLAEHEDRLNLAVSTIEEQKQNQSEEQNKNAEYEQMLADMRQEYEAELSALRETIENQKAIEAAQAKAKAEADEDNGEEVEYNANQINDEVLAQLERLQANIASLEEARDAEKAEFEQRYVELNKSLEESLKVQRLEMELAKERELNELKMKQALEAQRHEFETANEQELAAQREAIEEEKEQALAEMRKSLEASASKEQELAEQLEALRVANEEELAAEREAFEAAKKQELEELEALKVASEQELAAQREAIEAEKEQALAEMRKSFEESKEQELAEQLEAIKMANAQELAAQREAIEAEKEKALAAEREAFQAAKEQELAELEALKVANEQELAAQREAIEAEKLEVNEQANAIIASFKEEMNRQYEDFLNSLQEKKLETEAIQKEYNEMVEQSSPEEQAALKEQQYDVQEMMEQLREERKAAREEAQALREELEAQRMETEAKLMKQLSEVKEGLVSELSSELEIKEKFDAMEREVEAHNQEKLKQNEEEEARIKQEYEEFKKRIADEVVALEEKNAALQAELELARAEKNSDDETKQAEYEENEKRLREKYMQLRNELMKEAEQVNKQSEEIAAEKQMIEDKKKDLEEEKERLQNEVAMLKQQVLEIKTQDNNQAGVVTEEQLAEVRASLEAEYQQREKEMLDKLEAEKQTLVAREAQLKLKESNIEKEEERIREQSKAVTTMITNREYSKEERERLVLDYSLKLQDLEDRLRQNEKALRENNREFIPLRRIKNTLDRDLRLLRKREAIVAKQEVLVYGVNNISTVDPERIKKLEQDIKQLSGLQQSVANCETILNKNKDRYPTLENLDRVLRAQNEQIRRDLEEVKSAMAMFGENSEEGEVEPE